jgi:hypothetical protein
MGKRFLSNVMKSKRTSQQLKSFHQQLRSAPTNAQLEMLVAEKALELVDALERGDISLEVAEGTLFQLKIALFLEEHGCSKTCQEILTWGMQIEDWVEYNPEDIGEAYDAIRRLAKKVLVAHKEPVLAAH